MVLYILTGYQVLGIVYLDQLSGAHHTQISYHDNPNDGSGKKYHLLSGHSVVVNLTEKVILHFS